MRLSFRFRLLIPVVVIWVTTVSISAQETPVAPVSPFRDLVATPGGALPGDPGIQLVKVVDGLTQPVNVTNAGDGSGRIFVVERAGRIRIIQDGKLQDAPFLDVTSKVARGHWEQGLLGLAFDPNYKQSGFFYVYYNDFWRNGNVRLMRYHVSPDDPNQADVNSGVQMLAQAKPFPAHNAGELQFGPDGYLYVAIGDGGAGQDPFETIPAPMSSLLGKLLRIDVRAADAATELPYSIPDDNPYHSDATVRQETWAYGLRNPWQFSFDRKTGDLYLTDVGESQWEEIDYQPHGDPGGENYGWDHMEGAYCYPATENSCSSVGVPPVAQYQHGANGCAAVGIGVYRGTASPELDGIFFSADYCSGRVFGLKRDASGSWRFSQLMDTSGIAFYGGGEDEAGELLVTACMCQAGRDLDPDAEQKGALWRVVGTQHVPPGSEMIATEVPVPTTPAAMRTPPEAVQPVKWSIDMLEYAFTPSVISVEAGVTDTITLKNEGSVPHNFSVDELGISIDVAPGASKSTAITAPLGTYSYYCNIPGHKEAGMMGRLEVK